MTGIVLDGLTGDGDRPTIEKALLTVKVCCVWVCLSECVSE
jgi:hypothetical protein